MANITISTLIYSKSLCSASDHLCTHARVRVCLTRVRLPPGGGGETVVRRCSTRQQWRLKCFDSFSCVYEIARVKCGDTGNRSVSQEKGAPLCGRSAQPVKHPVAAVTNSSKSTAGLFFHEGDFYICPQGEKKCLLKQWAHWQDV